MADVLQQCSHLIGDAVSRRIHDLGGTERDVQLVAQSAAAAVLMWAAGQALGG